MTQAETNRYFENIRNTTGGRWLPVGHAPHLPAKLINREQDAIRWQTERDAGVSLVAIAKREGLSKSTVIGAVWRLNNRVKHLNYNKQRRRKELFDERI